MLCPCGSKKNYDDCCGQYISGRQIPATAEALMRSRYTAYTQANVDYIQATMQERAAEDFSPDAARSWAQQAKWKRLKVMRSFPHATDPHYFYVEFTAYFLWQGRGRQIHEISEFKWQDGRWFYIGESNATLGSGM